MSHRINRNMTPLFATFIIDMGVYDHRVQTIHFMCETRMIADGDGPFGDPIFDQEKVNAYVTETVDKWFDMHTGAEEFDHVQFEGYSEVQGGVISALFTIDLEEGGCEEEPHLEKLYLGVKPVSGMEV
jgi:hypothetical protein